MSGGSFQRIVNSIDVVIGIAFEVGAPLDFLGKYYLAIDNGGAFSVASAEIEANAAAVQVVSHSDGFFVSLRQVCLHTRKDF